MARKTRTTATEPIDAAEIDDAPEVAARLRLATARLARLLRQQAGTGLSPSLQSALTSVALHGPLTLGRLARIEQVTPPTITRIVTRLEDDGLVVREIDPDDRRIVRARLTAEGERRLEHSRRRRNAWLAQGLARLDPAQVEALTTALPVLEALASSPETDPRSATADAVANAMGEDKDEEVRS